MKKEPLILIGGGGHCRSCVDVIETSGHFTIIGILDRIEKVGEEVFGYKIIGTDNDIPILAKKYNNFLITIGQIGNGEIRTSLYNKVIESGGSLPTIISPHAYVSEHSSIGKGTILMHGVIVNANAVIGNNVIINTNALVEHDAIVCDHCHIATGTIINGEVVVGNNSFVGSGAITKQCIRIPAFSFIKANSIIK